MSTLSFEADDLEDMICFRVENTTMILECNWCDSDDYVFSKAPYLGSLAANLEANWLTRAAVHKNAHHAARSS